jgi:hypothetical protein
MRRTTLHRTTVAAAAAALLVAGCGSGGGGRAAGSGASTPSGPTPAAPPVSAPASPSLSPSAPPSPAPTASGTVCAPEVQLTAADTGRTVCLTQGGQLRLTLDGTQDRPWTTVKATGGALEATNAGIVIQPGDAVAAYEAVAPGTARLTATRPLCAKRPGEVSCLGIEQWTVMVTVTRP